jgi:hypothetical protein
MQIGYPTTNNFLYNQNGRISRLYQLDIGGWDMKNNNGVAVPHTLGINFINIFSVNVVIFPDGLFEMHSIAGTGYISTGGVSTTLDVFIGSIDNNFISLFREDSTYFSSNAFQDPIINRGRITLWVNT